MVENTGRLKSHATSSCMQQDLSLVERALWLLCIPCWLEANYIFLRTSHFLPLTSSSSLRLQQMMTLQLPQDGIGGSGSNTMMGASSNMPNSIANNNADTTWSTRMLQMQPLNL